MELNENDVEKVISEIYAGESMQSALKKHGFTSKQFYRAIQSVPSLELSYERAQAARAEMLAEEIVEIADTELDSQKARNMIDARKWYSSKMKPSKFGDRIDINVTQVVDIGAALSEARSRVQLPPSYPSPVVTLQPTEFKHVENDEALGSEPRTNEDPNEIEWE